MNSSKFFLTSNFGGGGQTVSRLFFYLGFLDDIKSEKINILLNYRYLKFFKEESPYYKFTPVFNPKTLEVLDNKSITLSSFFNSSKKLLEIEHIELPNQFKNIETKKDISVLLDTGSGALIRNLLSTNKDSKDNVIKFMNNLVESYVQYIEEKKPDFAIALDYADKNTYKDMAARDPKINNFVSSLVNNKENQIVLLEKSLTLFYEKKLKTKLYAPLHGNSEEEIIENLNLILKLENKVGHRFYGIALGGLAQWSRRGDGNIFIANIISKIKIADPLKSVHVLGSSGLKRIIPFTYAGADSFDCHTYWRRANDGSLSSNSESKIVIPLLDKNGEVNNRQKNIFENIKISDIDTKQWFCNCFVCEEIGISYIKNIYNKPVDAEEYYLSKILIYFHSVYQYQFLFEKVDNRSISEIRDFIKSLPVTTFSSKLKYEINDIKF